MHGILLKINSATNALIIIFRKFSQQIFLRAAPDILGTFDSYFNGRIMT